MNALIFHNPDAGSDHGDQKDLVSSFEHLGYEIRYQTVESKPLNLNGIESMDLIVVAGGDGTLRSVFSQLAQLQDKNKIQLPPTFIAANGTANNLALSLGIDLEWKHSLNQLLHMTPHPIRFGKVSDGDHHDWFFESVGIGIFAEYLHLTEISPKTAEHLRGGSDSDDFSKDFHAMAELNKELPAISTTIATDTLLTEAELLWLEVLNSASMGPRLKFLDHDPQELHGFSVVQVASLCRSKLGVWLEQDAPTDIRQIGAEVALASRVRISGKFNTFHVDDEHKVCDPNKTSGIIVECVEQPLMILRKTASPIEQ